MIAKWPHIGAVLAAGASSRMGTAKGDLVLPGGQTMLQAVIKTLESTCVEVVTIGTRFEAHRFVPDLRSGAGPLGGIEALLASGFDETYLISPNDIPLLSPEMFQRLTVPSEAVATAFQTEDARIQALPLRISVAALPTVTAALERGHNAVHNVLARLEVHRIPISDDEARGLRNINTRGDFDSIR